MSIRYNGHNISLNTIKKVRFNGHTIYDRTAPYEGLCFTSQQDGSSIAYTITGSINAHIQISGDGHTWQDWDGTGIACQSGGKIYVKNLNNTLSIDGYNYLKFAITGQIRASGSVMSLINNDSLSIGCFTKLFYNCTGLTSAPSLPATELKDSCYNDMFVNCTGLTSAPSLPATNLKTSCYIRMFQNCTGLTSAPSLPATNLATYCYFYMFYGCTGLTSAPNLPATSLKSNCYNSMFYGCTGLTSIPRLPATNLADFCYYQMFYGCTGLTSAPSLPATELKNSCYSGMFQGCSNLKVKENGTGGILFFTCPSLEGLTTPTYNMFYGTGGTFTGTPSGGSSYYYYNNTINVNITNGSYSGDTVIAKGETVSITLRPYDGYNLPETITVSNCDYNYDSSTGVVSLSNPTGDITITAECIASVWYLDDAYINGLTTADIGTTKTITVNGQTHTVRLIGIDHDDLADGTGKAHTTWEFANIISDENGNSLAIVWNDTNTTEGSNYDYINSSIRKALCGNGNFSGNVLYARKGQTTFDSNYTNKTILSMLPTDFVNAIKLVKKSVGTTSSYTATEYTDKLFMLSVIEMGYTSEYDKGFGSTYKYYENATAQTEAIRIKKQVNNSEVYTSYSEIPSGSGQAYQGTVYNYAGYNYKADSTGGGIYWLRSPRSYYSYYAWGCGGDGGVGSGYIVVCSRAYGVAPAFCLGIGSTNKIKKEYISSRSLKRQFRKITR